ncbi:MAG: sigma-24, subfamily [Candidatus Acidoferrum typicum]|nr:sigma-24, subfamily [Candidatus Acidoferrum typicum]
MNGTPENGIDGPSPRRTAWLRNRQPLLDQLFADSGAASWGLQRDVFAAALELSAAKRFGEESDAAQLTQYLSALHLQDLALACACAEGHAGAWDHFVSTFRPYLRSAAATILRCPPDSPAARELADSLFADLYGLSDAPNRRSLFRYFHGRSSLKTWLRAVLAQRHIDSIRASRRFTELEPSDGPATLPASRPAIRARISGAGISGAGISGDGPASTEDPHRAELVALFRRTLEVALGLLDHRDKERLRLYYAAEQTLAEIGRKLAEHESSVSRNLDRTRRELRHHVEQALRTGSSSLDGHKSGARLSDPQISLCFQYASEDASIDLDYLLPESQPAILRPPEKKP